MCWSEKGRQLQDAQLTPSAFFLLWMVVSAVKQQQSNMWTKILATTIYTKVVAVCSLWSWRWSMGAKDAPPWHFHIQLSFAILNLDFTNWRRSHGTLQAYWEKEEHVTFRGHGFSIWLVYRGQWILSWKIIFSLLKKLQLKLCVSHSRGQGSWWAEMPRRPQAKMLSRRCRGGPKWKYWQGSHTFSIFISVSTTLQQTSLTCRPISVLRNSTYLKLALKLAKVSLTYRVCLVLHKPAHSWFDPLFAVW